MKKKITKDNQLWIGISVERLLFSSIDSIQLQPQSYITSFGVSLLKKHKVHNVFILLAQRPGGGGHLGIFLVGMCRPGLQIGTPFYKNFPLKLIPRSRNGPIVLYPVLEFALKLITRSRNGPIFYTPF